MRPSGLRLRAGPNPWAARAVVCSSESEADAWSAYVVRRRAAARGCSFEETVARWTRYFDHERGPVGLGHKRRVGRAARAPSRLDGIHPAAGVGAEHPAHGRQLPPPLRQAPARAHPRRALAFQSGWVVDRPASAAARRLRRRTEDGSEHMDVRERDEARRRRGARPSGPAQAPPRRGRGRALVRLVRGAAIRRHRSARRVPGDDAAGRATRVLHVVKGSARVVRAVRARRRRARQCRVGLLRAGGRARAAPRETGAHGRRGASWHVAEVGRLAHEARAKARPPRRSPAEARGA